MKSTSTLRTTRLLKFFGILLGMSGMAFANLSVTSLDDSGPGSLRQAIADAAPGETIDFSVTGTITLTSGELAIDKDLTINGPGNATLAIGTNGVGNWGAFRISNGIVGISGLSITRIDQPEIQYATGIKNFSTLTISNCNISNFVEFNYGGAIENQGSLTLIGSKVSGNYAYFGGAILNGRTNISAQSTIIGCTLSGNSAGNGGGIENNSSSMEIKDSTISDNTASTLGGGVRNSFGALLKITNCTISGNRVGGGGNVGGIANVGSQCTILSSSVTLNNGASIGGIWNQESSVNMESSIVAGNLGSISPDFSGNLDSQNYNLIQNTDGATITGVTTHNIYGQDPLLGPLADNGGPTLTHALLPGSPAIDKGSSGGLTTDERGLSRPVNFPAYGNADDASDIGAYELQERAQTGPVFTVNTNDDTDDGIPGIAHCSLREAINASNANPDANTIDFAAEVTGVHSGVAGKITLTGGELVINQNLTINGPGAANLTVSGNNTSRVFSSQCISLSISGLTIADGVVSSIGGNGGGIQSLGGALLLTDCVVSDCIANAGGGIYCDEARVCGFNLVLTRCTITRNTGTSWGGGVFVWGRLTALDSSISSNTGGGIVTVIFVADLTNCTISGNAGDGLYWGTAAAPGYEVTLASCTITSNSGVGIRNDSWTWGTVTARNTIISGNSGGAGPDCSGGLNSGDFNLIQNTEGLVITGTNTHNIYNQDPMLGPLSDNGGPTLTHSLLPGSPAIDKGSSGGSTTDQRGQSRPVNFPAYGNADDGSDIGAYELRERAQTGPVFTVNTNDDTNDGVPGIAHCSLREAIRAANANPDPNTIEFATEVPGVHAGVIGTIILSGEQLPIVGELTVSGPGASNLTISGDYATRILDVAAGAVVAVSGLTIAEGVAYDGGGIRNLGNLTLEGCTITDCSSGYGTSFGYGGGIASIGALNMNNCTIAGCSSSAGGAICDAVNSGQTSPASRIIVNNTTISGNQGYQGSGIHNGAGECIVTNCTVSGNQGGFAGAALLNQATMTVANSTVCTNSSGWWGAGVASVPWASGPTTVSNCIIAGNVAGGVERDVESYGGDIVSGDHNLIRSNEGVFISGVTTHNLYGVDPLLGPLSDNGGPTLTHALMPGSPAIDHGSAGGLATDQRGQTRVFNFPAYPNAGDGCDIGAYELQERTQTGPVFTVNTNDDTDDGVPGIAHCSLREAINASNANPDANTIGFAVEVTDLHTGVTGTITLSNGQLTINNNVSINGPGADNLSISGNSLSRVFNVISGDVAMSGMTIENGNGGDEGYRDGGGVRNLGKLALTDCVVSNCNAYHGLGGGGISNYGGTLSLLRCTISGNRGGSGGGLTNLGPFTATNCTFSENVSYTGGGGIYNFGNWGGTALLKNCTVCSNTATGGGGLAYGGGIATRGSGAVTLQNTVVSGNVAELGPDCSDTAFGPAVLLSEDYNLIGNTNGCSITGVTTHNIYNQDPLLGPLADNGGPTLTHALLPGSPAIDKGSSGGLTADQRGQSRPINFPAYLNADDGSDIGAYELQERAQTGSDITVNSNDDTDDGLPGIAHCSLREAINAANANPDANTIDFAAEVTGVRAGVTGTISLTNGQLVIGSALSINGPGSANLTLSGNHGGRLLYIPTGSPVTLNDLTLADGHAIGPNTGAGESYGGCIFNLGTLAINRCSLVGNAADEYGGAIYHSSYLGGALVIIDSVLRNNSTLAGVGGAICNAGTAEIIGSSIFGNKAGTGGGIWCVFGGSSTSLRNSTLSGNTATGTAGGIGNAIDCTVSIDSSTICANSAGASGGGIGLSGDYDDVFSIRNSIVADNSAPTGPDVAGAQGLVSQDYNLIENTSGSAIIGVTTHNIYGRDPLLGPLADLGGPTPTHALDFESPAMDAGNSNGLAGDQRGMPRIMDDPDLANAEGGDGSDIGAYEVDPVLSVLAIEKGPVDASLRFNTVLGRAYYVESCEELNGSWASLFDKIPGTGSVFQAHDTQAVVLPRRFYRISSSPDAARLLAAHWTFSGNADDLTENGNDGSNANAVFVEDRHMNSASALDFDGTNSYVSVPNSPSLNMANGTSICFWLKARALPTSVSTVIGKSDFLTNTNYLVRLLPGGDLQWEYQSYHETTSHPIQAGKWHHVVVTAASPDGSKNIFVDGTAVPFSQRASTGSHGTVSNPLTMGCAGYGSAPWSEHLDGAIDDVRLYNRALTPTEVNVIYNQEK